MSREWIVDGDQAYTPDEWEAEHGRRRYEREYRRRRYQNDPEYRARYLAYQYEYRKRPERREARRVWNQLQRAEDRRQSPGDKLVRIVASLHDLACVGPTRSSGCRCSKTFVVEPVE